MVGKKIRCRNCNNVFVVEAPAARASPVAAMREMDDQQNQEVAHQLDSSNMTGTRKAMTVPAPPETDPYEFKDLRPRLRPSLPQQFPGSIVLEAWLPLALTLVAIVWSTAVSFGENESEKGWVPLVRIGTALLLYLLLIAPVTFALIKKNFRDFHRLLPPSPRFRTIATFSMPACFGYVFWIVGGKYATATSLITGIILGLVFMAAVFWLLMRLDPQEAATAYAWAAGAFVVTVGISVGIVMGANALLNQWMITGHAASFRESPLGAALSWAQPEPEKAKVRHIELPMASQGTDDQTPEPIAASQPATNTAVVNKDAGAVKNIVPESMPSPPDAAAMPKPKETGSAVFISPDKGPFEIKIEDEKLPWVKRVTPVGVSSFDATISPLAASPFIGLLVNDNGLKLKLGQVTDSFSEGIAPISLGSVGLPDQKNRCENYALNAEGTLCVHLNEYQLEIFLLGDSNGQRDTMALQSPPSTGGWVKPSLLGIVDNSSIFVRWSGPNAKLQYVQKYAYNPKETTKPVLIEDASAMPDAAAISAYVGKDMWFASMVQIKAKSFIRLYDIMRTVVNRRGSQSMLPVAQFRGVPWPSSDFVASQFENAQIAFSPDGKQFACLLEQGNSGTLIWWINSPNIGAPHKSVKFNVPTIAELGGHRGRDLQWLGPDFMVVHGQTFINSRNGHVASLPVAGSITGEQVVNDHTLLLTYTGPDGHSHLDVVELDTSALAKAAPNAQ